MIRSALMSVVDVGALECMMEGKEKGDAEFPAARTVGKDEGKELD